MSPTRFGKNWADVDEDDEDEELGQNQAARLQTPVNDEGIKQVMQYKERDGKTYKVTMKIRVASVTKWTNRDITERKNMVKFGKAKTNDAAMEASHVLRSEEEVNIDICRRVVQQSQSENAEDKFLEEALKNCDNLFKEKKVWTDINREKQLVRDDVPTAEKPDAAKLDAAADSPAEAAAGGANVPGRYVPPSLRTTGKGGGKGDVSQQQEASLRITNLSEDAKEGDLQELFGQFGRTQRVYLAKDPSTHLSKGFAFVTYYTRADAQKAIDKLNGHGYDNLILQVAWAKPRA
jgi:translation initiation factor 3 subunit G